MLLTRILNPGILDAFYLFTEILDLKRIFEFTHVPVF